MSGSHHPLGVRCPWIATTSPQYLESPIKKPHHHNTGLHQSYTQCCWERFPSWRSNQGGPYSFWYWGWKEGSKEYMMVKIAGIIGRGVKSLDIYSTVTVDRCCICESLPMVWQWIFNSLYINVKNNTIFLKLMNFLNIVLRNAFFLINTPRRSNRSAVSTNPHTENTHLLGVEISGNTN